MTSNQYGGAPEALTGDPEIYGRFYFSGYGRGILYGDRKGHAATSQR